MKLRFKHQKFQADAAKAVVDVFAGQPYLTPSYMIDRGYEGKTMKGEEFSQISATEEQDFTGWSNHKIVPELSDRLILEHLQKIQRENQIEPSPKLEGRYNLTVEMETGVGKTYTYIKTMYELNRAYGWSKFIVVVPSIAIREGVYKTFQVTEEHFAEEYGKKIRFFIYNSAQLTEIDRFASDSSINVMIINSQAFNARGNDARRIYMKLDEFRSRRPIDIIAKTNPILIIDEPQSVEGKKTKENLKQFNPLLTLRYSATHKSDSIYNMVYRLDAMDAYNKRLVKKIAVKGISESGTTATESYVYLESINLSKAVPTATIQFDCKGKNGVRNVTRTVGERYNLYDNSGYMEEYKQGFVVSKIDGRDDSVEFLNGIKIFAGDVIGKVSEEQLRRIQIRETILSHIQRERELFYKGIKVLSLFFIDEVAKYKQYDETGQPINGIYADMFEEEYNNVINELQIGIGEDKGASFVKEEADNYNNTVTASSNVKYDLIGKLVDETKLTRKDIIRILQGIQPSIFNQFKDNPEEFIIKSASLINDEKAAAIIKHISYKVMDDRYGIDVFTENTIKGHLGTNAMKTKKHLYDYIKYDSTNEKRFVMELETNKSVALYIKLPDRFYISTPVGHYNPDWAIAFREEAVKHVYFVAETKGSMNSMQLRLIEEAKIHCAREHFKAISNGEIVYDVVDSFESLWNIVSNN